MAYEPDSYSIVDLHDKTMKETRSEIIREIVGKLLHRRKQLLAKMSRNKTSSKLGAGE